MQENDIIILTDDNYLNKPESDAALEDRVLQEALEEKGLTVDRRSWADSTYDWSQTRCAIFRTTWDYFHKGTQWNQFLNTISNQTRLINDLETVRWNMDKHYLGDLSTRGIHIPETLYLEAGESRSLKMLQIETGWQDMILKPCFAGTARHTYRLNPENLSKHESIFSDLIKNEAFMLQPFLRNVMTQGEISIMIIGGQFTHAVIKRAKSGDFRVQSDFGGSVQLYQPTQSEIEFAESAISQCDPLPSYARVDIVRDNDNKLALIELELIEPEMWFRLFPNAASLLAEEIVSKLTN